MGIHFQVATLHGCFKGWMRWCAWMWIGKDIEDTCCYHQPIFPDKETGNVREMHPRSHSLWVWELGFKSRLTAPQAGLWSHTIHCISKMPYRTLILCGEGPPATFTAVSPVCIKHWPVNQGSSCSLTSPAVAPGPWICSFRDGKQPALSTQAWRDQNLFFLGPMEWWASLVPSNWSARGHQTPWSPMEEALFFDSDPPGHSPASQVLFGPKLWPFQQSSQAYVSGRVGQWIVWESGCLTSCHGIAHMILK